MKRLKTAIVLSMMILMSISAFAQIDLNTPIPMDKNYRIGKLENGLTYYIRSNKEPKERASFYIMRNAGALLENDEQDGLAHFLEHMAFNGTKNFPDKGIIKTLERHGVAFGSNVNAYTSQEETVYNLSDVPSTDGTLVDTCLLVLRDWASYLTLADAEIDNERGVIGEEWRTGDNSGTRMRNTINAVLLEGSQFAKRDVIGDPEVVKNFKYKTLRDFYHDWYRTDLTAIVVVGDINVDEMEAKIKDIFSPLEAVKNPLPRPVFSIPERTDIGYVLATDKEATSSNISIYMIDKDSPDKTIGDIKNSFIQGFYNGILSARVSEQVQQGNPYMMQGGAGQSGFVRGHKAYYISAAARPNLEAESIESVYTEVERMRRHGATKTELERMKMSNITNLDSYYKQKDKIANEDYVNEVKGLFLEGSIPVDIEYYYPMAKEIISSITVDDVNNFAKNAVTKKNMVITITGPSEGAKHATKDEILNAFAKVEAAEIAAYQDNAGGESLIDAAALKGSAIVKTKKLPVFNGVQWTLANGAKVIYAKADYDKNQVGVQAVSYGGSSLYGPEMLPSVGAVGLVSNYGLGEYDAITLGKMLAGKQASTGFKIGGLSESVSGGSSPEDFELMMQMLYMRFEQPRFDAQVFQSQMDRQFAQISQRNNNPMTMVQDSMSMISTNYHPRTLIMNEDYLKKISLEEIEKIYRDRIQDASDFTFYIVGNIDEDAVKPMVEKYIGSISSKNRKETWVDHNVSQAKGKTVKKIVVPFNTPKAMVSVMFVKPMKSTPKNELTMSVLNGILDLRYTENIREKEGGTYGVGVRGSVSDKPKNKAVVSMGFDCDPEKAEHLKSLLYTELETIKTKGVTQAELDNVVKSLIKNNQQGKESNSYVMGVLMNYNENKIDSTDPKNFDVILNKLTPADIQKFAKIMFDDKTDILDFIFTSNTDK